MNKLCSVNNWIEQAKKNELEVNEYIKDVTERYAKLNWHYFQ